VALADDEESPRTGPGTHDSTEIQPLQTSGSDIR
jgi:hypothetical protein